MIDISYKETAKRIRNEYLECVEKYKSKISIMETLKDDLSNANNELVKYVENVENDSKVNIQEIVDVVFKKVSELSDTIKVVEDEIEPIQDKINSLSKEEIDLMEALREKYHYMTDDDIAKEVISYLDK